MKKKITVVLLTMLVLASMAFAKKPRIAIADFEDKSGSAWGSWAIGQGVSDMLSTALFKSGKFDVYERQQMEKIMQEQNLQMSGMTTPESAVNIGKLLGVQYLVIGSINQFGQKEEGVSAFGMGVKSTTAHVSCDVRMIDVESGKIVAADTGDGNESATGIFDNRFTGIDFGSKGFDETIIGKATKKCVNDLATKITTQLAGKGLQGAIIKISDSGDVYINLSDDSGVKVGQVFTVMRKGEELKDPETGASLGSDDTQVGTLKIVQLKGKYCLGVLIEGKDKAKAGDMVLEKIDKK